MESKSACAIKKPRKPPTYANTLGDDDGDDQFSDDRWLDFVAVPKNRKALDDFLNEPDDEPAPPPVEPAKPVSGAVSKPKAVSPSPGFEPPPIVYGDDGEPLPWPTTPGAKAHSYGEVSAYEAAALAPAKVVYLTKGRLIAIYEWSPGLIVERMKATNQNGRAYGLVSSMINLLCEVLYWAEPNEMGVPRARGKNLAFDPSTCSDAVRKGEQGERGFYYVRYHRPFLVRRLGLTRWAVETALKKLIELGLLVRANGKQTKYKWLRPNFGNFVEYVQTWQTENSARLFKPKQAKKRTQEKQ